MSLFNKETLDLFHRVIDNANAFIIFADTNGNISICNKKVEDVTGKNKTEIMGKNLLDLLYQGSNTDIKQQMFKAVLDNSVTYKRSNIFEGVISDRANQDRLLSWNITPILSDSQELEGILFIGSDITELKEKEASFKKIDETIRNIFSSIKEYGLYVTNLEGNITYFGMGSEVMFGWQKNEIIFKHISILHTEEDAKKKLPLIVEETKLYGRHEEEDISLVKKNGETFSVILTVTQFMDSEDKLTGYIFIAKDITERKKLEYRIFQTEKLAALGQLVAGMAHEINNPLFIISGRLEMLLEQKRTFRQVNPDLRIISEQADRIRKLVDRLLMFSRQTHLKLEVIDINDAIDSVLPFLSYQKSLDTKIQIEKDLAKDLPPIKGSLSQLQEVFMNLFINACQAMPDGGKLSIKTSNLQNQFVEIRIGDSGCGIPEQNLKNIFMPFFTTKKDGTGLGLSICYNIIKNHSGVIEIETLVNKGTTFIIKLPFA